MIGNFDHGFWLIQRLDCSGNKLKNPGISCRKLGSISRLATIICLNKTFFCILAHCAESEFENSNVVGKGG